MRVLTEAHYFSPEFVSEFEKNFKLRLVVTERATTQELLRDALSHFQDYDLMVVPSFALKSFLIENLFSPLESNITRQFANVSIDFQHLDFDPDNRFLMPLSWSITGFLVNSKTVSIKDETLGEVLQAKHSAVGGKPMAIGLLDSPVELFSLVSKLKPVLKNWVETDQADSIAEALKELRKKNIVLVSDPREQLKAGTLELAQIQQGRAAHLVGGSSAYRFVLPKERGTLKISFVGVSRSAKDRTLAQNVVDILLRPAWNKKLVEQNEEAAVVTTLNDSDLPLMQKPRFIREVPLSRVDLFILHEALEPTWLQALSKEFKAAK